MSAEPVPRHQCLVEGNAISGIGAARALSSARPRPSSLRHRKDVVAAKTGTRPECIGPIMYLDIGPSIGVSPVNACLKSP
jgi:hypothetical protein